MPRTRVSFRASSEMISQERSPPQSSTRMISMSRERVSSEATSRAYSSCRLDSALYTGTTTEMSGMFRVLLSLPRVRGARRGSGASDSRSFPPAPGSPAAIEGCGNDPRERHARSCKRDRECSITEDEAHPVHTRPDLDAHEVPVRPHRPDLRTVDDGPPAGIVHLAQHEEPRFP